MIEQIDLSKFRTGLELEEEFNRIIKLALDYKMSHIEAEKMLIEIGKYGVKSGKFFKSDWNYYLKRRNCHKSGKDRTNIEFVDNLKKGQNREHAVFLYFLEWFKKKHLDETIQWEYNGSDANGYIMIVNGKLRKVIDPDYKIYIDKRIRFIEAKSFHTPPTFKIANIKEYITYKKNGSFLVFKYNNKYYVTGPKGMESILRLPRIENWKQQTVVMSENYLNIFLKNGKIIEIRTEGINL